MCKHWDCVCYAPATESCDYILIYGKSRGCPATDKCPHYRTDFSDTQPVRLPGQLRRVNLERVKRMKEAYDPKLFIEDMAARAHVSEGVMLSWVRKEHPEHKMLRVRL